jgi:hypothetical protein
MTLIPMMPLTPDQRALLHLLFDAPDAEAAQAGLAGVPLGELEVLAERVGWMHAQIVQAHNARRERIVRVAQNRKETRR